MKYKDYEGPVEELVLMKLKEIEKEKHVKILYAVESGSRSWGVASPDSDYDVRFVYLSEKNRYLSLQEHKDHIDWELNEVLDINGWDLKKVLRFFHGSNAAVFEWANSPAYYTTPEWESLYKTAAPYFSCKSVLFHYYGTAMSNYQKHFQEDMVQYKKYIYVLRPLLCCKWIEEKKCPPAMSFDTLMQEVLEEEMRPVILEMLEKKVNMPESGKAPKIEQLSRYIEEKLKYYKQLAAEMPGDKKQDWEPLEEAFLHVLDAQA